jgi:transcriptional regulator GlxA family with amidase domain
MSKEVLLQQRQRQRQVNPLQNENDTEDKEEKMIQDNMEQEIECPRCCEMMALSSDFDRLCYFCQECSLSLLIN